MSDGSAGRRARGPARAGPLLAALGLALAGPAAAQTLVAADDAYGVPFGEPLVVEAFGVLENDTLDGENAGEGGATAQLVADASHGALALASDGSFSYAPGVGFEGTDAFSYRAVLGGVQSDVATVTLSACTGGPVLFACWKEAAFLARVGELGFGVFTEGFEDDAAWGAARSPDTQPAVPSRGLVWTTNHPATNGITTGGGPARTGSWGVFDPDHGVATGTPAECDVDAPPAHCLYHDGFTATRAAGRGALHAAGGYVTATAGANLAAVLDGTTQVGLGQLASPGHQFLGVVDASPAGFTSVELRELDGKVGQALYVWGDDFTFAASETIPAVPARGLWILGALLAAVALWWSRGEGPAPRRRRAR